MKNINIVVTDDHKLFRRGIIALLSDFDFIDEINEAGNGVELLILLEELKIKPDIILLDVRMPEMDGVEAQKRIRKIYPDIKIIILTMEDDEQFILHLIHEGVNGYLLKNADPDEMELAILKTVEQGFYFPDDISKLVMNNLVKQPKADYSINIDLSERELLILDLICKEFTATEMADSLDLSPRTIEGYRRKLLEKTGAKNMAGLVVFALKHNLVSI
jgi:DNA-binding NarL/FixJ family response regulator